MKGDWGISHSPQTKEAILIYDEPIEVEAQPVLRVVGGEKLRPFTELTVREMWIYSIPDDPTLYQKWIQIASGWLGGIKNNKNAKNWYSKLEEFCPSWYLVGEDGLIQPTVIVELIKIQDFTQENTVLRRNQTVPVEIADQFFGETQCVRVINEFVDGAYISDLAPNPTKPKGWSAWERLAQDRLTTWKNSSAIAPVAKPTQSVEENDEPVSLTMTGGMVSKIGELQNWREQFKQKGTKREKAYLQEQRQRGFNLRISGEAEFKEGFIEADEMLDQ